MVVGSALIAAVFLGGFLFPDGSIVLAGTDVTPWINFLLFLAKSLFIVFLLALVRTLFARMRIDQMLDFSWKYLATGGILQLFIAVVYAGALHG
jgi:NADH-quinone oxidoreductase subunit H